MICQIVRSIEGETNMTLKQLQYIVMIAETGNITEAAREVQIAAFSTAR